MHGGIHKRICLSNSTAVFLFSVVSVDTLDDDEPLDDDSYLNGRVAICGSACNGKECTGTQGSTQRFGNLSCSGCGLRYYH